MNLLAGLLILLLTWPALASEKMSEVTIDGASYVQIQDVHVVSGGRIVILYPSGGTTVTADKLSSEFLASWGITKSELTASKEAAVREADQSFNQAVRAGYFREVEGVIYDLRKAQPGWIQFSGVKILEIVDDGALIDSTPLQPLHTMIFIRHLPHTFTDNESITFMGKLTGGFSYMDNGRYEHTIRAYDVGRICKREEIPDAIVKGGQASAVSPNAPPAREHRVEMLPNHDNVRGIGSGFFVSRDGYIITNFHVVKDATKVEVKYKTRLLKAEVVDVDTINDLAVLKVPGADFPALTVSRKDSADLGDPVFTIGFPNIEMQGLEPKYTSGQISSLAGMLDDPSEYQISVPVQPGNSGGPLCDANGDVVGIVVARLNDMAALRASGVVPQNVNYAVKAKLALRLMQSVKGLESTVARGAGGPKPAKPVAAVEDGIAMIMIY